MIYNHFQLFLSRVYTGNGYDSQKNNKDCFLQKNINRRWDTSVQIYMTFHTASRKHISNAGVKVFIKVFDRFP